MFRHLTALTGLAILGASNLPAQAQLASSSTQFDGTVPAICQVVDQVNASSPMTFLDGKLSGVSQAFSFESNGSVALQLRQVQINSQPAQANNYNFNAGLKIYNGNEIASATQEAMSQVIPYAKGLTANDDFQMTLTISAPKDTLMAQGQYVATVTTDCIAN